MLYPAHILVTVFVTFVLIFWLTLILWIARSGLLGKSGESVKYKVFDGESEVGASDEIEKN